MRKLFFISLFVSVNLFGQHVPLQSQYLFNGIALNPAFTGSEDAFSIIASMRAQWVGFPGAPTTQAISAHGPFKKLNSAFGVQLYADQIGVNRNTGVFGSYAYRIRFEKSTLSLGVAGGVNMMKTYYSRLDVNDQVDELLMVDSPLGVLPDFSFGVHYFTDKYFLNFSLPMFLSHDYDGLKFKVTNNFRDYNIMLGGGYIHRFASEAEFRPSILLKYRADSRLQADFNIMGRFNRSIDAGISYRTEEALVGLIKVNANKQLSFMYSFGFPLSPLFRYSYGSHELSIKYSFLYETKIESPRFIGW